MASKSLHKVTIGFNAGYAIVLALFFMDAYSSVEIKWQPLKTVVYYSLMAGSILVIIWNGITIYKSFYYILLPSIVLTYCLITGPMQIVFNASVWQTQVIVYKPRYSGAVIAFQMKDIGALGYKKRTVQVRSFTPLFEICSPTPTNYAGNGWYPVFEDANETGLNTKL